MDFIISQNASINYDKTIEINKSTYLSVKFNNEIKEREHFYEDKYTIIIADANISFIQDLKFQIKKDDNFIKSISRKLKNGFVILVNRELNKVNIYTDIFGFYHLFYIVLKNQIVISSSFDEILQYSSKESDPFSLIDMILFNYTLLNRTVVKDIKRFVGGSEIQIINNKLSVNIVHNYARNFFPEEDKSKINIDEFIKKFNNSVISEISDKEENILTVTGGFDSRTLLASLYNQNVDFSSITFGQKGNIEIKTIEPFINKYSSSHELIELNENYKSELIKYIYSFINLTLDNPTILDLPHYLYVRRRIKSGNLITGFMGGEILTGQSVGAQVTFTEMAKELLIEKDIKLLRSKFLSHLARFDYINMNEVNKVIDNYIDSVSEYFNTENKTNILRFLINEKYSKFFGTVNKIFRNYSNLIIPYMDKSIIDITLSSNISFLEKEPFRNSPLDNLRSKIFQAKMIKKLCPTLGETKFDRLYSINDLLYPHRYPAAALGYFRSHILKTNKIKYPKPHFYDQWYAEIIKLELHKTDLCQYSKLFKTSNFADSVSYNNNSSIEKKGLTNLMSFKLALEHIIKS